jgi:ketosteroid isomerase-like protein
VKQPLEKDKKPSGPFGAPMDTPVRSADLQELYRRLQPSARRGKAGPEVAAALEAAQKLSTEIDAEDTANATVQKLTVDASIIVCPSCGYHNREGNKFCGMCGAIAVAESTRPASQALVPSQNQFMEREPMAGTPTGNETHHYHHHYHHHYFPGGGAEGAYPRSNEPAREDKMRPNAALRGDMSRAEAAVRRITHEWVLACNTRHLDDLLELYVSDALVLRSNYPPIRGAAAVREFFFGALDAGLGEVEVEPLRVEVVGDLAYEAGRCKALSPSSTGKRREERGKYLWVFSRQSNGEWKLAADCWSSDLTLTNLESDVPANASVKTTAPRK